MALRRISLLLCGQLIRHVSSASYMHDGDWNGVGILWCTNDTFGGECRALDVQENVCGESDMLEGPVRRTHSVVVPSPTSAFHIPIKSVKIQEGYSCSLWA